MKTLLKLVVLLMLVGLVLGIVLVAAGASWLAPLEHTTIQIDGDSYTLAALQGSDWLALIFGVLLAVLILVLVVPVAVLAPLLLAALVLAVALFTVVGVAALLASPLLLIGWLLWRLARHEKPRTLKAGATIAG